MVSTWSSRRGRFPRGLWATPCAYLRQPVVDTGTSPHEVQRLLCHRDLFSIQVDLETTDSGIEHAALATPLAAVLRDRLAEDGVL